MSALSQYAKLLAGDLHRNRILCPGPGHSRADRSLSVTFHADGSFTTHSFAGDDFRDCRDHVKATLGLDDREPRPLPDTALVDVRSLRDAKARVSRALSYWEQSKPIGGTPARTYLESRCVPYTGEALRWHSGTGAMLALMTDINTGEPTGVHRTFVNAGGVKSHRKMLGIAKNAVVRLSGDAEVAHGLGLAEGIETALAAPFRPVWACLSAGTMKVFPVLSGIDCLTIFADHDAAGIEAANDCGKRWHDAGREVALIAPSSAGFDFADLAEVA
jgi:hypothetical protein